MRHRLAVRSRIVIPAHGAHLITACPASLNFEPRFAQRGSFFCCALSLPSQEIRSTLDLREVCAQGDLIMLGKLSIIGVVAAVLMIPMALSVRGLAPKEKPRSRGLNRWIP